MMIKQLIKSAVSTFIIVFLSGSILQSRATALGSRRSWANDHSPPLPAATQPLLRQQREEAILGATVRYEMGTWVGYDNGYYSKREANGHGTVMNGRYLLTHNHLDKTITERLLVNNPDQPITIKLYNTDSQIIVTTTAEHVTVAAVAPETLVLDFGQQGGEGFLAAYNLTSAQFMAAADLALEAGTLVAQVDWDGTTTYVEWVSVATTQTISETAVVQLTDRIEKGASGGGVYWNGVHIGNNWKTSTAALGISYSHAALNAPHVLDPN